MRLWRTLDWSLERVLTGHQGSVESVAFLPEGKLLFSAGDDWTVRRWNLETGESQVFARELAPIRFLAASPDGKLLAWSTGGIFSLTDELLPRISLCDAATGTIRKLLLGHTDTISALLCARLQVPGVRRLQA